MTENADLLLTNAIVLTMDEELNQFDPGAVALSGDSILAVGTDQEIRKAYTAPQEIDCEGKVVMPGLINSFPKLVLLALICMGRSFILIFLPFSATNMARCMVFSSSLMFPGQSYSTKA